VHSFYPSSKLTKRRLVCHAQLVRRRLVKLLCKWLLSRPSSLTSGQEPGPEKYVAAWKVMTEVIRKIAPKVIMVWSPNIDKTPADVQPYFPVRCFASSSGG
jgi:hypothetical protein